MIVVTGAAGFIGSALIWALNQKGIDDIIAVDKFGIDEKWKNLRKLKFKDILGPEEFLDLLEAGIISPEVVVHLGACSSTTEKDFGYLFRNNFMYSKKLCLLSLNIGSRFVYASSAATYGVGEKGFDDGHNKLMELRPLNGYAFSKHIFDLWAWENGLLEKIVGIKYFNVFGPNEYHKGDMRSMVLKAFEQIRRTGRVQLFKSYRADYRDGEQRRDFIYIKDAVEATLFLIEQVNASGIYNIGTGIASTWIELVSPIFEVLGCPVNVDFIEMPETLKSKYQYYTCANISKLKRLGYNKKFWPLEEAVKDYVGNYLLENRFLGDEVI